MIWIQILNEIQIGSSSAHPNSVLCNDLLIICTLKDISNIRLLKQSITFMSVVKLLTTRNKLKSYYRDLRTSSILNDLRYPFMKDGIRVYKVINGINK